MTPGLQALSFLMEQHGLRQADLPEIGSQGVVSEVLAGKRALNVRQIRALAQRFRGEPGHLRLKTPRSERGAQASTRIAGCVLRRI